ncbi:MAG: hypothetical protein JWO08_3038, partial [Verrucomicrobiaceae bacterium]|nr:hypothetical protein [Verrucomicrobiaceae bacterium]
AWCFSLIVLFSLDAAAREFTDVQGRKLEGELVSVSGPQAVIKRTADGQAFTVMASQFSADDQKFMQEFGAAQARYVFEVKLVKDKLGATKTKQNNVTYTSEEWAYKVALTNRSTLDAEDLRVDYWLFLKSDDGKIKAGPRVQQSGSTTVKSLKRSGIYQFQTKTLKLSRQELDGGFYFADGTKNKARDSVGGVAMRFFKGDKEVYAWATDPDLLKSASGRTGSESANEAAQ